MKIMKMFALGFVIAGLAASGAFAAKASLAEKGKAMFNDPKAFGGTTACSSCHPAGKGLENAADKKQWTTPAGPAKTLEDAINLCIVNANKGKALDAKSEDMKAVVAYLNSLKEAAKKPKKMAPGY